ncbi:hypothetical protein BDV24DRAFT_164632 [Aspergillus arachidicola]|uniref:Uncharacterized protein n=1 Tax=Aspergillus arachidicola TaxID=656916 RepID=A0A5N6Y910_9EURO|nr:hypothetical protein BDV24DRAFT_164632 [Aspergillus arachidicola]
MGSYALGRSMRPAEITESGRAFVQPEFRKQPTEGRWARPGVKIVVVPDRVKAVQAPAGQPGEPGEPGQPAPTTDPFGLPEEALNDADLIVPRTIIAGDVDVDAISKVEGHVQRILAEGRGRVDGASIVRPPMSRETLKTLIDKLARAPKMTAKDGWILRVGSSTPAGPLPRRLEEKVPRETMDVTDIVVTTVMNPRELVKRGFKPNVVIFDEASFFRDPELFHALSILSRVNRVHMVGITNSLPLLPSHSRARGGGVSRHSNASISLVTRP